jgi:hypothetical protein
MFTIKAITREGNKDIYEANIVAINKERTSLSALRGSDHDVLDIGENGYYAIYVENSSGKTIEHLHEEKVR